MRAQATVNNHLRQATRNRAVAQACATPGDSWEWRQWAVTAAFYAAVHFALALSFKKGDWRRIGPGKGQTERFHDFYSRMIRSYANKQSPAFERLKTATMATRYHLYMPPRRTVNRLVNRDLVRIELRVRRLCST